MWIVQLLVISFGFFTLITDAVGLGLEDTGSIGIDRAFITRSIAREERRPRAAGEIGEVLDIEDSSQCCEACNNKFTDYQQTHLFNFEGGSWRLRNYRAWENNTRCICLENKNGRQIDTREAGVVTGTCDPCFETDVHHLGNELEVDGIGAASDNKYYEDTRSSLNCQELCQEIPDCQWFNWRLFFSSAKGKIQDECWLLSEKGDKTVPKLGGVSGPKYCPTGNDGVPVEVDGDLGDGKGFIMLMDDLYLGNSGISSRRINSKDCCSMCVHGLYPETQMFQYFNRGSCDYYKAPAGNPVPTHRVEFLAGICGTD